ncbi:MAG: MFS transporter [Propionibacteriaceae bacterium]|nr:MFS transporter [Propionibacteriaceae bacterium]
MSETKLPTKKVVLLSFGFFSTSLAWSLYNAYVPLILKGFISSTTMIGFIMVFDNIAGVILQPVFGNLSDRTHTRFGRRMPYIMAGIPVCALVLTLIPRMESLWALITLLIVFCIVMAAWRTPVVSLMPDITPGPQRSQANGIVNALGGVGSLLAFVGGGFLLDRGGYPLPFLTAAIVMVLALIVLLVFVREPKQAYEADPEKPKVKLARAEVTSLLLILGGVFFWFVGYNAVETFFTLYASNTLGVTAGQAGMLLGVFSVAFLAFAVPAGFIGAKFGRRRTILVGLAGVTVLFIPMVVVSNLVVTVICLFGGGLFWACVNINSLPMVVRLATDRTIGTFVGYYYFFSVGAQIVSPILAGAIIDSTGTYRSLFLYCCIAFAIAAVLLAFVRHGEDDVPDASTATEVFETLGD